MQTSFHVKDDYAYQKVMIEISSTPEEIFPYLATTKGVQQWFPELSYRGSEELRFDLGDGTYEDMEVMRYDNPNVIHFTWATGEVEILLEGNEDKTQLILNERLPLSFETVAQDFTGWQFKVKSIKNFIEQGETVEHDPELFASEQKKVEEQLNI
ncbi:MAG: hypothetical protein GX957_03080 [Clostridiaceae bacterium]|nr:hypothetical protein [Clostridiaceae bacterium]